MQLISRLRYLGFFALMLLPFFAQAQSSFTSIDANCQITAPSGAFCGSFNVDGDGPISHSDGASTFDPGNGHVVSASTSAGYNAFADYGRLGVDISIAGSTGSGGAVNNATASVNARSSFFETFTAFSPASDPVTINYVIPVEGAFSVSVAPDDASRFGTGGSGWARVDLSLAGANLCWDSRGAGAAGICTASLENGAIRGSFSVLAGSPFFAAVSLELFGQANAGGVVTSGSPSVLPSSVMLSGNYGSTVRAFFDAEDPLVELSAASGHNYTITAIPEPSMFVLLMVGLLVTVSRIGPALRREI